MLTFDVVLLGNKTKLELLGVAACGRSDPQSLRDT